MKNNFYKRVMNLLFLNAIIFTSFNAYAQGVGSPLSAVERVGSNQKKISEVIIYRESGKSESAVTAYIDGHVSGVLLPGTYAQVQVCQGVFQLSLQKRMIRSEAMGMQNFIAKNSEITYIKVSEDGSVLKEVLSTEALQDLKSIKSASNVINRLSAVCESSERTVNLGSDALFAFDGSDISPTGVAQLESFVSDLKKQAGGVSGLKIIGYTDSLGDESYNEALSLARASSVARYLEKQGLDLSMEIQGRGESEPVSMGCEQFKSERNSMIACLQPDRRVVIELLDKPLP